MDGCLGRTSLPGWLHRGMGKEPLGRETLRRGPKPPLAMVCLCSRGAGHRPHASTLLPHPRFLAPSLVVPVGSAARGTRHCLDPQGQAQTPAGISAPWKRQPNPGLDLGMGKLQAQDVCRCGSCIRARFVCPGGLVGGSYSQPRSCWYPKALSSRGGWHSPPWVAWLLVAWFNR